MVVLQFHVSVELLKEIKAEANATGKTISEVSRAWLVNGKPKPKEPGLMETALDVFAGLTKKD